MTRHEFNNLQIGDVVKPRREDEILTVVRIFKNNDRVLIMHSYGTNGSYHYKYLKFIRKGDQNE